MIETKTTRAKKVVVPLIIEPHPKDYSGLPFITLIQYRKQIMLVVVDNMDDDNMKAYVLDLCGPERVSEELLLTVVSDWYENNQQSYPLSVEFSRRGLSGEVSRVHRSLNVEFITRIIGPVFKFPTNRIVSVKRRRRKGLSDGIEISRD